MGLEIKNRGRIIDLYNFITKYLPSDIPIYSPSICNVEVIPFLWRTKWIGFAMGKNGELGTLILRKNGFRKNTLLKLISADENIEIQISGLVRDYCIKHNYTRELIKEERDKEIEDIDKFIRQIVE